MTWSPDHTVVVPDLRGMGLSAKPSGFDRAPWQGRVRRARRAGRSANRSVTTISAQASRSPPRTGNDRLTKFSSSTRRCRASGRGRRFSEPAALALPLRRAGHGAAGRGRERITSTVSDDFSAHARAFPPKHRAEQLLQASTRSRAMLRFGRGSSTPSTNAIDNKAFLARASRQSVSAGRDKSSA